MRMAERFITLKKGKVVAVGGKTRAKDWKKHFKELKKDLGGKW